MRESPDKLREMQPPAAGVSPLAGLISVVTAPWGEATFLRVYSVGIAMAAFLNFTGAIGTGSIDGWTRFTYWLVVMLGGTIATQIVAAVVERFARLEPLPEALVLFVTSLPAVTVAVWLLSAAFNRQTPDFALLRFYAGPVLVITAAMSAVQYLMSRTPRQSHVFTQTEPKTEPGHALRERLPFKYRHAELYALSAEDHYLRVVTSAGDTLILMRLYDAIKALDGIEGSQVHRSWWVAKDAITDVARGDGRVDLTLKGGATVPVSRTYQKTLKATGWL